MISEVLSTKKSTVVFGIACRPSFFAIGHTRGNRTKIVNPFSFLKRASVLKRMAALTVNQRCKREEPGLKRGFCLLDECVVWVVLGVNPRSEKCRSNDIHCHSLKEPTMLTRSPSRSVRIPQKAKQLEKLGRPMNENYKTANSSGALLIVVG